MTGRSEKGAFTPTRRMALMLIGAGGAFAGYTFIRWRRSTRVTAIDDSVLTEPAVLHDPDVPVIGNLQGDVTIAAWTDYQCPDCRRVEPVLQQVVQNDGKVRLVLKNWPILGPVSVVAAQMALAAKFQDKFHQAHDAMMGARSRLTESRISELLAGAGVDMDQLKHDLDARAGDIDAVLRRNRDQAKAFRFDGVPSFIVGKFRVPGELTVAEFEQAIAGARKMKAS